MTPFRIHPGLPPEKGEPVTRGIPCTRGGGWRGLLCLGALAALLTLAGPQTLLGQKPLLKLGLVHPRPALCLSDEASQRDLRLLRILYGLGRTAENWNRGPWYLDISAGPAQPGGLVSLDTKALWGRPLDMATGLVVSSSAGNMGDPLLSWRRRVVRELKIVQPHPERSQTLTWRGQDAGPFLASRLAGSAVIPALTGEGGGASPGWWDCRTWPADVAWRASGKEGYEVLLARENAPGGNILIHGYAGLKQAWQDYRWGRLDGLLLEGLDIQGTQRYFLNARQDIWLEELGGQQVALRFSREIFEALKPVQREALSMAIARVKLSRVGNPHRFRPAEGFLSPLLEGKQRSEMKHPALVWNTYRGRQAWLADPPANFQPTLVVLDHPYLRELAETLRTMWVKTLNLNVEVLALPLQHYYLRGEKVPQAIWLEVADLDNGTLQDLWEVGAEMAEIPLVPPLRGAEVDLGKKLPYLPLLENRHYLVMHRRAQKKIPDICPDCQLIGPPIQPPPEVAPKPEEEG